MANHPSEKPGPVRDRERVAFWDQKDDAGGSRQTFKDLEQVGFGQPICLFHAPSHSIPRATDGIPAPSRDLMDLALPAKIGRSNPHEKTQG